MVSFLSNYQTIFQVAIPFYIAASDEWKLLLLCKFVKI